MKLSAHITIFTILLLSCLFIWTFYYYQSSFITFLTSLRQQQQGQLKAEAVRHTPRYMTYLPHSGLHNQRISLINALVIAHALNRTLLMPELNIGQATFWADSQLLAKQLELCVAYIRQNKKEPARRLRCQLYSKYRALPVESIFGLSSAHALDIHTEQRSDMSRDYIPRHASAFQLNDSVYTVPDLFRYSYQLCDYDPSLYESQGEMNDKYLKRIRLDELKSRPETYLEFGSLFGTSRLQLHEPELIWLREHLHRTTGINHPEVNFSSKAVIEALGENYTSVHLRQGNGIFQEMAHETIAQVESVLLGALANDDANKDLKDRLKRTVSVQERLKECRSAQKQLQQDSELEMIYLATDASNPQHDFSQLFDRYPCIFTLGDFYNAKVLLQDKKKDSFKHLLPPMIDAEIASHAKRFIGTRKSTYSAYVRYRNQHYRGLDFFTQ